MLTTTTSRAAGSLRSAQTKKRWRLAKWLVALGLGLAQRRRERREFRVQPTEADRLDNVIKDVYKGFGQF